MSPLTHPIPAAHTLSSHLVHGHSLLTNPSLTSTLPLATSPQHDSLRNHTSPLLRTSGARQVLCYLPRRLSLPQALHPSHPGLLGVPLGTLRPEDLCTCHSLRLKHFPPCLFPLSLLLKHHPHGEDFQGHPGRPQPVSVCHLLPCFTLLHNTYHLLIH